MLVKTLIKNSVAVGLTAAGCALQYGVPNSTALFAALGTSVTTFLLLPPALKAIKMIPQGMRNVRDFGTSSLASFRKKTSSLANTVNPADPDQNVLLGLASGFLASQAFAETVDPLVNAAIDALPLGKPTKVILKHPRAIATVSMTALGGLTGYVLSDKRVGENLQSTNKAIVQHAAASDPAPSASTNNGGVTGTIAALTNAASRKLKG